jgi:hypothetical protein
MSERTQKLIALRARTDHDLLTLIERELDRCHTLINTETAPNSRVLDRAEQSLTAAKALLPRIAELNFSDRLRLEAKQEQLRTLLDQVLLYYDETCAAFAS